MSKPTKNKKEKVPKITEAEYAEYISTLKKMSDPPQGVEDKGAETPILKSE